MAGFVPEVEVIENQPIYPCNFVASANLAWDVLLCVCEKSQTNR
jgi:hypothetical protein